MKNVGKRITITVAIIAAVAIVVCGATFLGIFLYNPTLPDGMRVVAYITAESITNDDDLKTFDFSKTTHLIYAFAHVSDATFDLYINNQEGFSSLVKYVRENSPDVKILLSVASSMDDDGFCNIAKTDEGRVSFARQCSAFMDEYNIDGIDIDWEYPRYSIFDRQVCDTCRKDHAALLETLREVLPSEAILSFAAGCGNTIKCYVNTRLSKVVDFVNVMLYDFRIDDNSPFDESKSNIYNFVLQGYSKRQLNWGLPFYGRCADADYDYFSYARIMDLVENNEACMIQQQNNSYAEYNGRILSFDSYEQIEKKAKYAKKRGYGGVFCWHMSCDRDSQLMDLLWNLLRE